MSSSNDALTVLRARRRDLYEQLGLMDRHVAAVQDSPFVNLPAADAAAMGNSIERVEKQIGDINRQIGRQTGMRSGKP